MSEAEQAEQSNGRGTITDETVPRRRAELSLNLERVRDSVRQAASLAGRAPGDVELVVVTKTWPASDVVLLRELGQTAVAENRVRELADKRSLVGAAGLCWHLVGGLQANKAAAAVKVADVVESVDRESIVEALATAARSRGRVMECLMQVNLDPHPIAGRSGVRPEEALRLADLIGAQPELRLGGVMGVGPRNEDPVAAFEKLSGVAERVRRDHPGAETISAGMSLDYVAAIAAGATQVRIGTAVLGDRPSLR